MNLRPDELAAQERMQRDKRIQGYTQSAGQLGAMAASSLAGAGIGGALASGGMFQKILPFLNRYVPADLALKGISKVSPKIGSFLKHGVDEGLSLQSGLDFLKENIKTNQKEKPKESLEEDAIHDVKADNPLWRFSKKLAKLVDDAFKVGHTLDEVEKMAQSPGNRFRKDIHHIEKSMGMPFKDLLKSIYGSREDKTQNQTKKKMSTKEENPKNESVGQGQQALMQMLQKINERMNRTV